MHTSLGGLGFGKTMLLCHRTRKCKQIACIFLFNLICSNEIFIADDLIQRAEKMGADEVIAVVIDKQSSPWLWSILFSRQNYRANGLAIKLVSPKNK